MQRVAVYILAGGKSARFGSDKARAIFGGRELIVHVAQVLAPVALSMTVVADVAGKYQDLGLRTIGDRTPGCGPMSGLDAALADLGAAGEWLALVSCDLAGIQAGWAGLLREAQRPDAAAVAFRGEHWEPLCALYHRRIHSEVMRRLAERALSMQRLLDGVGAVRVALPPDWPAQANTPAELARIRSAEPTQE